ncbi:hypothetical protein DL98DRAFT_139096 [Cadophora sp. DSE1049]|nr:hypothetical protein DL98DRAFT_139096 [Cadophora sp. DSE1049]
MEAAIMSNMSTPSLDHVATNTPVSFLSSHVPPPITCGLVLSSRTPLALSNLANKLQSSTDECPNWVMNLYFTLIVLKVLLVSIRMYILYYELRADRAERRAMSLDEETAAQECENVGMVEYVPYEDGNEKDSAYGSA